MAITTVGLDVAKNVFQRVVVPFRKQCADARYLAIGRKDLSRRVMYTQSAVCSQISIGW